MADQTLNCEGLSCPLPIVNLTRQIRKMETGQLLEIRATDLAFQSDLEAWSRKTENAIESFVPGDVQVATIRINKVV